MSRSLRRLRRVSECARREKIAQRVRRLRSAQNDCSRGSTELSIGSSRTSHRPSAARELRDRWLEQVNAGQHPQEAFGKYDLSRAEGAAIAMAATLIPAPALPAPMAA